ncbi:MAG: hypothetical protein VX776_03430 [Planctomycetota bacterium]|nr:hypothetical protein [Planctomycetota bacterium]
MSPEWQLPGAMPTPQSDIYSLGSILFQMLTGMVPFPGGSIREKLDRHANAPIEDLSPFGVEESVNQFLHYLMAKNPGTRFQSVHEVVEKLERLVPDSLQQLVAQPSTGKSLIDYEAALTTQSAILNIGPLPTKSSPTVAETKPTDASENSQSRAEPPNNHLSTDEKPKPKYSSRRHSRRKKASPWANPILWGGIGAGILGIIMGLALMTGPAGEKGNGDNKKETAAKKESEEKKDPPVNEQKPAGKPTKNEDEKIEPVQQPTQEGVVLIDDDGETLWASPTAGEAINLAWTPPGAQLFITIEIAELLGTEHGPLVLQAFGPEVSSTISSFETDTGVALQQVDQMVLSWLEDEQGQATTPHVVVYLSEKLDRGARSELLGDPDSEETENGFIFQVGPYSALIPEQDGVLVFGSNAAVQATLEWGGKPPLLRRTITQLLKHSDNQRHVNVLMAPSFLFNSLFRDGNAFYFGEPKKVREPLQWLLGEGLEAMLVSFHFDEVFYMEARMSAGLTLDKRELITQIRDRMDEIPDLIESYMVDINPSKHWRALAFRFPGMIRFLHSQTRIQVEGQTPVLNIAMPIEAAPNIFMASELSLASEPGATPVAGIPTNTTTPQTIEELLKTPMSVDIPQQDLNLAIADIVKDVRSSIRGLPFEFDIKIDGNDLMDEGITRNQAIRDFVMEDKPLEEVLTGIVRKANPVTTVQSPTEKDQKLVWLIADDPVKAGNKIILLTTRKAAESKQYTLPSVFVE